MAKFNEYPVKATPKDADKFMLYSAEDAANKLIDYDKLADAVLNKLTSKTFGLDQGTKTLPAALNELNGSTFKAFNLVPYGAISDDLKTFNYGIARYSSNAKGAPSDDNGYLISIYRSETNRIQIALSDVGNIYVRTTNSSESFQPWISYNKVEYRL